MSDENPTDPQSPPAGGMKHQAARQARWTTLSSLANVVLQLAQVAVLSRLIDKADFGIMGMAWVVIAFAVLFEDAGLTLAVVHKQKSTREQLSTLFWTNWGVGLVLCGLLQLGTPWVVEWSNPERPELLAQVFRTTALFFAISPLGQLFVALMWRDLRFKHIAVVEIGAVLTGFAAAVAMGLSGFGVFALVAGHICRSMAYVTLAAVFGCGIFWPKLHWKRADLRGYLGFGVYQMADRISLYGVRNFDKLLIGRWFGEVQMGLYVQAWNLMFRLVTAINPILTRVTTALFSRIQDDDPRLCRGFLQLVQLQTLIMAPVGFGIIAVAPSLVRAYLGEEWEGAIGILQCLAGLVLFFSLRNGCGSVFTAKGRMDLAFRLNLAAALLAVPAIFVGKQWGLEGIALGLVVSQAVVLPYQLFILHRLIGLSIRAWLAAVVPLTLCAAAMCGAVLLLADAIGAADPGAGARGSLHATLLLGALVGAGGALYGALVWMVRRDFAREMLGLVRKKRAQSP